MNFCLIKISNIYSIDTDADFYNNNYNKLQFINV